MANETTVRDGTGAIVKFFRIPGDTLKSLKEQIEKLSDKDFNQLVTGIRNGTYTY